MSRIKKYWIRYNKGADRLEQQITIGILRPNGPGWVEIDVDNCCNTINLCTDQVIEETIEAVVVDQECGFFLTIDGLQVGGIVIDAPATLEEVVDQLNIYYEGFATFEIVDATAGTVKITVLNTGHTIGFEQNCVDTGG